MQKAKDLIAEQATVLMNNNTSLECNEYTYEPWKDDYGKEDKISTMKHRLTL